jgi:hypothetical protein
MSLVIGRGYSVNEYARNKMRRCAKQNFTFGVNDAALDFPCDIVVALDAEWIKENRAALLKLDRPIITREWDCLKDLGLDLITLPHSIVEYCRLSGMAAAKISDGMSEALHMPSHVVGLDATHGHYDRKERDGIPPDEAVELKDYERLNCLNTVNLGIASRITCWPKSTQLPFADKPSQHDKQCGELFVRMAARRLISKGINI